MSDERRPFVDSLLAQGPPPGTTLAKEAPPVPRPRSATPPGGAAVQPAEVGAAVLAAPVAVAGELVEGGGSPVPGRRARSTGAKHLELVRRVDEKIRVQASEILLHAFAAEQVDEGAAKPEGWSDRKYRTAQRAIKCGREAPAYIAHAARMVESYRRSEALEDRKPSPTLNCEIVVNVGTTNTYNYPVIKVRDE